MKYRALLSLLALTACDSDKIMICTLLGCAGDGLMVHLSNMPATPFRVELVILGSDQVTQVYDCTATRRCSQDVFFADVKSPVVSVTVRVGAASRTSDVHPVYSTFQPNGPDCPPTCRSATVTIDPPVS
jgi:hypothetical protein